MSRKNDDGFIPALGISEEQRDLLAKRDWSKPQTHADHPDTWTTQECIRKRFSGYRINAFTREVELWVVGQCRATRTLSIVQRNPGVLADMHEEAFSTIGTLVSVDLPVKKGKKFLNKRRG